MEERVNKKKEILTETWYQVFSFNLGEFWNRMAKRKEKDLPIISEMGEVYLPVFQKSMNMGGLGDLVSEMRALSVD